MRRLPAVATLMTVTVGLTVAAQQQSKPETAASVAGKWAMVLEMSMGTGTPTLDLKQEGEKITGTYTGRYGTFPLRGTIKGRAIEFEVALVAEGRSFTMNFAGEVAEDGKTMKGTASLGELGGATWSAKKQDEPLRS
jgi:hypothetical protein